jgi:hypothetical protein
MDNFLKTSTADRLSVFTEAAFSLGINLTVLEKDFWVCWTLSQLFNNKELFDHMVFKGGTSLSKSYGLIDRFSEDCDLTINRSILNVKDPSEAGISSKELQRRIDSLMLSIRAYIKDFILPVLANACKNSINNDEEWKLDIDQDGLTILFSYPTAHDINNQYVQKTIKLELGARGGISPKQNTIIKPYIAESVLGSNLESSAPIPTLSSTRTFWEKLTILHGLYYRRLKGKEMAARMSRHYYDVYMLAKQGIDKSAMLNLTCLDDVIKNNIIFFKDNNASQNTAKLGSFCLVPNAEMLDNLRQDYKNMEVMILGETPSFDEIIKAIKDLEVRLNN